MKRTVLLAALLSATALSVAAQELRIGLAEDPDVLDPDQSRTFVGRIVYTALCDKLVDISPELDFVPQLATEWGWNDAGTELTMTLREGVVFHDGTPFDAAAVVANIERSRNLPESRRKSEIASIAGVEATGDHEVRITLAAPDATLLAQLADRAGMMVSPTAAEAAGTDFGANPVCSGPFKFVERVAQDRIVLEAFPDYWNAGEIHLDRVVYLPIPDGTVRFANLQSGDLDLVERLQATDLAQAQSAAGIKVETAVSLGYDGITFNVGNGAKADNPFGKDGALLRQAFSVALDRAALNQVVFDGVAAPGNQSVPPSSQWYVADFPVPTRDIEKAKALLAEAGHVDGVELTMQHPNSPEQLQVAQVIQAMVAEAGISVSLQAKEFASMLADQTAGEYQASLVGWSGRVDPDGNLHQFVTTAGGLNDSKYANPEVDRILDAARQTNDVAERKALYTEATAILDQDLPIIYLYHDTWIWALKDGVSGFVPYPDAMIRLQGVTKAE